MRMKKLATILLTGMISLSLLGQQDIRELKKERYVKKHRSGTTALAKKNARYPAFASRQSLRPASEFRSASLKALAAGEQKLDSLIWEFYDPGSSTWMLSDRELYSYDSKGNMTTYIWFAYDADDREILPYDKEMVKYNAQGLPTEITWLTWDKASGQWINSVIFAYTYDAQGKVIRETTSDWDTEEKKWMIDAQYDKTYDGEGRLITEIWSYWDDDSAKIVPTYKDELIYEEGKLTTWNEYVLEEGEWVLVFRTSYTYDSNGNLTLEHTEIQDADSEMWFDYAQYMYSYNESGQLIMEEVWEFDWTYFTLLQSAQYEYTWDTDGNLIEQVDRNWDQGAAKGTDVWLNAFKSEFSYNKEYTLLDLYVPYWFLMFPEQIYFVHMPVSELGYVYEDDTWVMDFRQSAYYSDFEASTSTEDQQETLIRIYPVPASESLTFAWDAAFPSLHLEVYDLSGKRLVHRSVKNQESIAVDHLSGGIYLYKLSDPHTLIYSGKLSIE